MTGISAEGEKRIIRPSDLGHIILSPGELSPVSAIMPLEEILAGNQFKEPELIRWPIYPDFNSLVRGRDRIRRLELLPIKTFEDRLKYHAIPKERLVKQVEGYFAGEPMALAPNAFPDSLPRDVDQYLLWTQRYEVEFGDITEFVAKIMKSLRLGVDDVILFERSRLTNQQIIRGTFPEYRHIHFWRRII